MHRPPYLGMSWSCGCPSLGLPPPREEGHGVSADTLYGDHADQTPEKSTTTLASDPELSSLLVPPDGAREGGGGRGPCRGGGGGGGEGTSAACSQREIAPPPQGPDLLPSEQGRSYSSLRKGRSGSCFCFCFLHGCRCVPGSLRRCCWSPRRKSSREAAHQSCLPTPP